MSSPLSLHDAQKLSPLSLRLRAFLRVLADNQDKPQGPDHPVHLLPQLLQDIQARLLQPDSPPLNNDVPAPEAPEPDAPPPERYREALRFMRNPVHLRSSRYRAQQWRADRSGAPPELLDFERRFIARFEALGVPMFCHCLRRSDATQGRLFVTGVSRAGPGQSPHNHAMAVDLVHGTRAWDLPKPCWDLIGHMGKEVARQAGVDVMWGGDWKFYDPAHWELRDWKSRVTQS